MSEQDLKKDVKERTIKITLVDGSKINGRININRNDGYDRLSDLINSAHEPFLIIVVANIYEGGNDCSVRYKTIFVNKKHILWATPEENER